MKEIIIVSEEEQHKLLRIFATAMRLLGKKEGVSGEEINVIFPSIIYAFLLGRNITEENTGEKKMYAFIDKLMGLLSEYCVQVGEVN